MSTPAAPSKAPRPRLALVTLVLLAFSGCESTDGGGYVSGGVYYGVGFYDPWYYGGYQDDIDVIVTPPGSPSTPPPGRPTPPPRPAHPIAPAPSPTPRPTPMPSIPRTPMPRARGR